MNTRQIDYVLELAKTLNFNRAAEHLFITQPTLTYQIKSLEEEIGFTITILPGTLEYSRGAKICNRIGTKFIGTIPREFDNWNSIQIRNSSSAKNYR